MDRDDELDQAYLKKLFSYDETTGVFTWNYQDDKPNWWNTRYAGKAAGSVNFEGYIAIGIKKRLHLAHRLAWIWAYDIEPPPVMDHINRDRTDNRITNLREVSRAENSWNAEYKLPRSSGMRGAIRNQKSSSFHAQVRANGKKIYLGSFKTAEEASAAYLAARERYQIAASRSEKEKAG